MKFINELIKSLESQGISYRVSKSIKYITVDYGNTTVDGNKSNLKIVSITHK